jgi:hypothetical protein
MPDLVAGERLGPEAMRHATARVVREGLRGIVDDREVRPAVLAPQVGPTRSASSTQPTFSVMPPSADE